MTSFLKCDVKEGITEKISKEKEREGSAHGGRNGKKTQVDAKKREHGDVALESGRSKKRKKGRGTKEEKKRKQTCLAKRGARKKKKDQAEEKDGFRFLGAWHQ